MKLTPLTALFLIACGTSAPSKPSTSTDLGSAAEAIRQLGRKDADVVQRCEQLVQRCEAAAGDSGVPGAVCERISEHCSELAEQLSEARSQFEECLARVAACEEAATDPGECRDERRACNPAGQDFESRRGETLACAERTQSCLPKPARMSRGRGADDADAGANTCDGNALDFVGCCHGHGGGRPGAGDGDAGALRPSPFGSARASGSGPGPRVPRLTDDARRGEKDDADDAPNDAQHGDDDGND